MKKTKLFVDKYCEGLINQVNSFGEKHKIVQIIPVSGQIMRVLYETDKEE